MADPVCDQLIGSFQVYEEKQESIIGTFSVHQVYGKFFVRVNGVSNGMYSVLQNFGLSEGES